MTPVLELRSISVSFGKTEVLRELELEVRPGEILGIIGPNGSGKSTTVLTTAGAIRPKSGRITFKGQDITSWSSRDRVRAGITLVAQGHRLFYLMNVEENLLMGAYARTDKTAVRKDRDYWLERFPRLEAASRRPAGTLSGGEQQMLAIARGMMAKPSLCLLDEPSLGVAPGLLSAVGDQIRAIRDETGVTFVLVEQDIPFLLSVADRVVVMSGGRTVLEESPDALRDGKQLHQVFFGLG